MGSIVLKDVTLSMNNHPVLVNINEEIPDGSLYYLMGTAGSGKSSFLKAVNGLFMDINGKIFVDDEDIYNLSPSKMLSYHMKCSFVFQNSALISNMSILDNLSLYYNYHTKLSAKEILEKIDPFLKTFNIPPEKLLDRPHFLSTGQRMLFNIIRGLLEESHYYFWDEPIANLDMIEKNKVKKIIKEKKTFGKTTILVTNDWEYGLSVADKVGVLHQGKLIFSGEAPEVLQSTNTIIRSLISDEG